MMNQKKPMVVFIGYVGDDETLKKYSSLTSTAWPKSEATPELRPGFKIGKPKIKKAHPGTVE
jgi:hypothetical protein